MSFLVNLCHENNKEHIEDEFGDEWRMKIRKRVGKEKKKKTKGEEIVGIIQNPDNS